jgi:HK97 gp10 family phage protein
MALVKGVKIEGMKEAQEMLKGVMPREARNIMRRTTFKVAGVVRQEIRDKAPVLTGNLKRSIKAKRDRGTKNTFSSTVYVDRSGGRSGRGYHWHLVEFGARGGEMPAQPFVVPTIEAFRPKANQMFSAEFGPQFEKELAKRAKKKR